ncbi:MAG TPA: dihydropteroate synthase [Tabrizicola sp.]|nr:dihydropteroate synthase [Tabrizicola sp.]
MDYFRPIAMTDAARPVGAYLLAGGWCWFDRVEVMARDAASRLIAASDVPAAVLTRLTSPRGSFAGLALDRPRLMGILNVTPDSFSDGGKFQALDKAVAEGRKIARVAEILDIGGESTRPGAAEVTVQDEITRVVPVIEGLRAEGLRAPISTDTRKSLVAISALQAGASLVNDVSALGFDPAMGPLVAKSGAPLVLMHAQGRPETMQDDPFYDDVLLDVYDALAERLAAAEAMGIDRSRIAIDPGIGFGKTQAHNLELLRGLSLFHGLGCPILLGTSRKRFIGAIGQAERPEARMPGSVATALAGVAQGVQIVRVHDVAATRQALRLWQAMNTDHLEAET